MRTLSARGVFVRLGDVQALDDVSIALAAGQATMLAGPNGAGKTTLLKVLLGLTRADFGAFAVDGERARIDRSWKRRIGYLPEAVAFSENLTGYQQLRFFARARGVPHERVAGVLDRVGLADAARRRVRGYSRGMRQRLGLAIAILAEPELLVLDEPTGGLDQEGLRVLWTVLEEWQDAERMVLIASHDLALMERRVDQLCLLKGGRMVAHGSADDLRRAAQLAHRVWFAVDDADTTRVQLLCEAMTKWGKGRIERRPGTVVVDVAPEAILELMEVQSGFPGAVRGLRVEEPTLDLAYDKLLGVA